MKILCAEIRCAPLSSTALDATCTRQGENSFTCDRTVLPGTLAKLSCKSSYNTDKTDVTRSNTVKCGPNGQWDPQPIKCFAGLTLEDIHEQQNLVQWINEALNKIEQLIKNGTVVSIDPKNFSNTTNSNVETTTTSTTELPVETTRITPAAITTTTRESPPLYTKNPPRDYRHPYTPLRSF